MKTRAEIRQMAYDHGLGEGELFHTDCVICTELQEALQQLAKQRTVIIWDSMEGEIKFLVVDGDRRHLNGQYLNQAWNSDQCSKEDWYKRDDELNDLMTDEGQFRRTSSMLSEFPTAAVLEGAFVIVCGFVP